MSLLVHRPQFDTSTLKLGMAIHIKDKSLGLNGTRLSYDSALREINTDAIITEAGPLRIEIIYFSQKAKKTTSVGVPVECVSSELIEITFWGDESSMNNDKPKYPEVCMVDSRFKCHLHGMPMVVDCTKKSCKKYQDYLETGIFINCLERGQKRYSDTIGKYHAITKQPAEHVKKFLEERFRVGPNWYENKLEGFSGLPDGSGYKFTILEPYTD